MKGAMAATVGVPGQCSCLQVRRKTELMCITRSRRGVHVCVSPFSNRSRLQHYRGQAFCAKKNKSQKPKLKITLLDGLCKELSAVSNSLVQSNGAPAVDGASLADQVRGRILSDALEVITRQLAQVKAERKERKRQLKAQKKALKSRKDGSSSSSSSSSESSDSEWECEVVDVSDVGRSSQQEKPTAENDPRVDSPPILRIPAALMEKSQEGVVGEEGLHLEFGSSFDRLGASKVVVEQPIGDKIEVCMGPKCKKMGSDQLLAAFEGCGVEAVGCKCMGKCRSAPNVRVQRHGSHGDDGCRELHLGVGMGDIESIVSPHLGEREQMQIQEGEGDALVSP